MFLEVHAPARTDSCEHHPCRGSKFLKDWMEFLEENADLRYPDLASLAQEA